MAYFIVLWMIFIFKLLSGVSNKSDLMHAFLVLSKLSSV